MSKAVINLGYKDLVMDAKDALTILELLASAEVYKEKWAKEEDGGSTYHIHSQDHDGSRTLRLISDDLYRMARLAGKPEA